MDPHRPPTSHLPDLQTLQLFLQAVDSGSLSKAAQHSHIAVSAASRRIAALEDQLGVRLLERTRNGVVATPAGTATAEHVRHLLRGVDRMRHEVDDFRDGGRGHVRLHANTSVMAQELPGHVASFLAAHPDLRVEMREHRSRAIADALREGSADVGIVIAGVPLDGLDVHPYRTDRLIAIVPRGHPIRSRSARFATLIEHEMVGLDDSAALTRLLLGAAESDGRPLRLRAQAHSFDAVCRMVAAGLGIAVLPEGVIRTYRQDKSLRYVAIAEEWSARQMYLCTRAGATPQIARVLVHHLLERVRK